MSTSWTRRSFLRGSAGAGLAVVSGGALLTACASTVTGTPRAARGATSAPARPTTTRPARRGPVTVGVTTASRNESSELTGQSIDLARRVLDNLDVRDTRVVRVGVDSRLAELATGRVDLLCDLDFNRANCRGVTLSAPDYVSLTALGVPAGNPKGLKTFAEVVATGATVVVLEGVPHREDAIRAGVPAGKISAVPFPQLLTSVTDGRADCVVFYDIALRGMVAGESARLDVTAGFTAPGQEVLAFGFAFAKDKAEDDLVRDFNTELGKLHESGEWLRISAPFGYTKDNMAPADLTAEKLCAR